MMSCSDSGSASLTLFGFSEAVNLGVPTRKARFCSIQGVPYKKLAERDVPSATHGVAMHPK